jgi:hypothetical protein
MILVGFKKSKVRMNKELEILGDKGYQGIKKIHTNSRTPLKKTQKQKTDSSRKTFQLATSKIQNYY